MSNLENLGDYGTFSVAAKAAGGVEPLLRSIRTRHMAIGAVVGLVAGVGATVGVAWAERRLRQYRARKAEETSP